MARQSFHENLDREDEVESSSNRSFGLVFAVVFTIIALWPLINGEVIRLWSMAISAVFAAIALALPGILTIPNKLWTKLGTLMSKIVSPIALGLVYFTTVVPIGLIMRALGKDTLGLTFKPDEQSYWIKRDPPGPERDSFTNQF